MRISTSSTVALPPAERSPVPTGPVERAIGFLLMLIDVFREAQAMAHEAHRRHPFADW